MSDKEKAKKLEDFDTIIVELSDKKSCFNDPVQGIMLTESDAFAKVKRTPFVQKALVQGVLKTATEKQLEEHKIWYKNYVAQHSKKANEAANILAESAESTAEKVKAEKAKTAAAKAENKVLQDELEAIKAEKAALEAKLAEKTK